jgi:hypothetical protein
VAGWAGEGAAGRRAAAWGCAVAVWAAAPTAGLGGGGHGGARSHARAAGRERVRSYERIGLRPSMHGQ